MVSPVVDPVGARLRDMIPSFDSCMLLCFWFRGEKLPPTATKATYRNRELHFLIEDEQWRGRLRHWIEHLALLLWLL